MNKYYHDFLEEMRWLEEKFPHIRRDYEPLQEE
jgi:hypothetical protein